MEAAVAADAKVVAFGDSGQLSAVQAGGWLGALTRRVGSFELREVMRQRDPGERRALAKVHRGQSDAYLAGKESSGELVVFCGDGAQRLGEEAAVQRSLVARERFGPEQAVLICRDNQRRERLNALARER
ncbi:MAG: AAA family ATPase, partial [Solirubrobacteraceae bacterium]